MTLVICLDDSKGMLFNNRRQIRDKIVTQRILSLADGKRLLMNPYSAKLFSDAEVIVDAGFLSLAEKDDVCFAEQKIDDITPFDEVCVFLWNRAYPSDVTFDIDLPSEGFALVSTEDFEGSSHEKVTLEVYKR